MKKILVLLGSLVLCGAVVAFSVPATQAAIAKTTVTASHAGKSGKLCTESGGRAVSTMRTAEADSCTECYKQNNGCCEAVCSRASDGACYVLQCCPGKDCTKLNCT